MSKALADSLRALADKVEALDLPESMRVKVELAAYSVTTIEGLRAVASLMKEPIADRNKGTHWLKGDFADRVEITAYYVAGLLGKVKKQRVVMREKETTIDMSRLTEEPANV